VSGGEVGVVGEVLDGGPVGACRGAEPGRGWWVGGGGLGEPGTEQVVMGVGEELNRPGFAGGIEADYLNGEVVLLGRLHGVAARVNALLQQLANRLAATGGPPGSTRPAEFDSLLTSGLPAPPSRPPSTPA